MVEKTRTDNVNLAISKSLEAEIDSFPYCMSIEHYGIQIRDLAMFFICLFLLLSDETEAIVLPFNNPLLQVTFKGGAK